VLFWTRGEDPDILKASPIAVQIQSPMQFPDTPTADLSALARKKRPIVSGSIVLLICVCLSMIAIQAINTVNARKYKLIDAAAAGSNMAAALAEHAENSLLLVDTILMGLADEQAMENGQVRALPRTRQTMSRRTAQLPVLRSLILFDEHGSRVAVSGAAAFPESDAAARAELEYHRGRTGREAHIGVPVRYGSASDWIIPMSRRLDHADGSFAGIALAAIDSAYFQKFYNGFDIGQGGAIIFARDDGTLLLRRPYLDARVGTSMLDSAMFHLYEANGYWPTGSGEMVARLDQVERLYSYHHLERYPIIVAAALAKEEVLAGWLSLTYHFVAATGTLTTVLAFLGARVIRQIVVREQLEEELRVAQASLEARNAALRALALNDGLTGLANRRHFEEILAREFSRAARSGAPLALIMLDVDYFKKYNDLYGHPAGDVCLCQVAQAINEARGRAADLAARYGGEEFAVLLPETDLAGALAVAEKIRLGVEAAQLVHAGNPRQVVTISAGVYAQYPRDGGTSLGLVETADRALYAAKNAGRNAVSANGSWAVTS
jgi:diguanylate cyclase (GGDEF)-like protein